MKKRLTLLLTLWLALMAMPVQAAMYIVGNTPFGNWTPNAGLEMTQDGTTYTATAEINGTVWFVFTPQLGANANDWGTITNNRLGPTSNNYSVTVGETYTAYSGQGDNSYQFTGSGIYTFTFDPTDNTFTVTTDNGTVFDPITGDLFVLGEAEGNGWDPSVGVELSTTDGNVFTGEVTFNGEHAEDADNVSYFSFTTKLGEDSNDWGGIAAYRLTPVCDGNFYVTTSQLGNTIGLNEFGTYTDNSFRIPAGTYTITVNVSALTCVITKVESGTTWEPGWPSNYGGVMLQGFYWDSYTPTSWANLTDRAQELGQFFDVIWVPQSGKIDDNMSQQMGYNPVYWLDHNSCFGTETQLRTMINTYRKHNTSMMAEVVLNHKSGVSDWTDLANETDVYGSTTGRTFSLSWTSADICNNDECVSAGYEVTGATDEGDGFDGGRDLDHTSANVQANVKTYEDFLLNELGYAGFRYDMSKGYAGYYTGLYNAASKPTFSVGEYWDGNATTLRWWLDQTKQNGEIQSAVFDFALKYSINDAFGSGTWSALGDKGLSADASYQRYSVSFIDNHDTGSNYYTNSLQSNIPAANAFILAMPGTPCIFLKHYQVYANEIQNCIRARKAAGIHNQSSILTQEESNGGYILETQGTNGNLYLQLGGATSNGTPSGYTLVQEGDNYKLFITSGIDWAHVGKDGTVLGYPVVSLAAGNYVGSVTLTVAPSASGTTLVYTTDGSEPTATSTQITASQQFAFSESTVLRVGVLNDGQVENVETYIYTITEQATTGINVYVQSSNSSACLYAWNADGTLSSAWPGSQISSLPTKTVGGIQWHYLHVDASSANVILNDSYSGFQNQTATIPVSRDVYLVYPNTELAVSSYGYTAADTYKDVTEQYAGGSYVPVYVMGNVNATGWAPNNGIELTTEDGETYTAIVDFSDAGDGYGYFGFTTQLGTNADAWDAISSSRFGATENDYLISDNLLGTEITCASGTNSFKIPTGMYKLTLQLSTSKLTVEAYIPSVYVMGNVNATGWAPNNGVQMTRNGNTYTATIDFVGAYGDDDYSYFSFTTQLAADAEDWDGIAAYRFGAVSEGDFLLYPDLFATELSCVKVGYGGEAFKIPTGKYDLTLNWETRKLVVTAFGVTRGDVNGNGAVTLADVTALVNYLTKNTNINVANADCNGDGQVTTDDIARLVKYVLSGSWK